MKFSHLFRNWTAETLLIIVAIGLGVGVLVATGSFIALNRQAESRFTTSIYVREQSIVAKASSTANFFQNGTVVDAIPAQNAPQKAFAFGDEQLQIARRQIDPGAAVYTRETFVLYPPGGEYQHFVASLISPEFLQAFDIHATQGRTLSAEDFAQRLPVMMISSMTASRLGLGSNAVGSIVRFKGFAHNLKVIGVYSDIPPSPLGNDVIDIIMPANSSIVPARTLYVMPGTKTPLEDIKRELALLTQRNWTGLTTPNVSVDIRPILNEGRRAAVIIAIFSSIGLLIASMNIMNMMLARVLRRQLEIGIRRSVGASQVQIFLQFLSEALLLSFSGGLLGLLIGQLFLVGYNSFISNIPPEQRPGLGPISLSIAALIVGLIISVLLGVVFGLFPAVRASRVRIVEALKS